MASLGDLNSRMRRRARNLSSNVARAVRTVALAVDREVVTSTPVDTGRARSNWIVSINTPFRADIEPYSPHPKASQGSGAGTAEGANAQAALNQGAGVIARVQQGHTVYVQNNVPYIEKLNNGSSLQAPKNFVGRAVMIGVATLRRVAKNIFQ